jgi:VWFA-related protein
MFKPLLAVALILTPLLHAQTPDAPTTISVRSSIVLVPAFVKTKKGVPVYTLTANDFLLTDDGIPQPLSLEEDTGGEPLALVVLVETGGDGARRLDQYRQLDAVLDAVIGGVEHKIAVVGFDSSPKVLQPFTANTDEASEVLAHLQPGDNQAAILDALSFSVDQLRQQPPQYRRAILLLSETLDRGSHVKLNDALRAIGDTNTAIYSMAFSSSKSESTKEAAKLNSSEPGPAHGCFAHDPNSTESRATQNYDCIADLLPPLRLAKIAEIAATNSFKRNIPQSVAQITGGEYFPFKDQRTLVRGLLTFSNHIPNRYILSFHPQSPHPGFHTIQLKMKDYANLTVEARNGYWVETDPAR